VISRELAKLLNEYIDFRRQGGEAVQVETPLFPSSRGGPLGRQAVWRIWRAGLARAGVPRDEQVGTHGARHLYATSYYGACRDLRRTQVQLGHRRSTTTEIYTRVLDSDRFETAEKLYSKEEKDHVATE
jgi:integrase